MLSRGISPKLTQMRIAESRRIFQSISQQPIESDMRRPDQRNRNRTPTHPHPASQRHRQDITMTNIVNHRPSARPPEISGKAHIRHKKKNQKQHPRIPAPRINQNSRGDNDQPFQPQPTAHSARYRSIAQRRNRFNRLSCCHIKRLLKFPFANRHCSNVRPIAQHTISV